MLYITYTKIQLKHKFFVQLHVFTLSRFLICINMFSRKTSITQSVNVREVNHPILFFQFNIWSTISKSFVSIYKHKIRVCKTTAFILSLKVQSAGLLQLFGDFIKKIILNIKKE